MNRGHRPAALLGLALAALAIAGRAPAAEPAARARLAGIRQAAGALHRARVEAERRGRWDAPGLEALYRAAGPDLTPGGVRFIRALADSCPDPEEARSLRALQHRWAVEVVNRCALPMDAVIHERTRRDGPEDPAWSGGTFAPRPAPGLDSLLARRQTLEDSLLRECGYPHYAAFSEAWRDVDLAGLLARTFSFIRKTRLMYETLLREQAREIPGREPLALRRADLAALVSPAWTTPFFPGRSVETSAADGLAGLELDFSLPEGAEPRGGVHELESRFHAAGVAFHRATIPLEAGDPPRSGSEAGTRAMGRLLANLPGNTEWLRRYRGRERMSDMSDVTVARLVRRSLFWNLFSVRRAGARLLFESIAHPGRPELHRPYFFLEGSGDEKEIYRQLFGFAYGFDLTPEDVPGYRAEVGPYFEAADDLRGMALAAVLEDSLESRFGPAWFADPEAGAYLRDGLPVDGSGPADRGLAGEPGGDSSPFDALEKRMTRLFSESEAVLESARR